MLENVRFNQGEKKGDARHSPSRWPPWPIVTSTTPSEPATAMKRRWSPSPNSSRRNAAPIGFLVEKELHILETLLAAPEHPYVAVMGGAKVSDKISVIENLSKRVDKLLIGGAMTYTFLKARGIAVGKSKVEADKLDVALGLLDLPGRQARLADGPPGRLQARGRRRDEGRRRLGNPGRLVRDGHRARRRSPNIQRSSSEAGTVVWNGPMGMFEVELFAAGHQGDRSGARRLEGRHRRRRRRVGRGRREIWPGRSGVSCFNRRRGVSRSRSRASRSIR